MIEKGADRQRMAAGCQFRLNKRQRLFALPFVFFMSSIPLLIDRPLGKTDPINRLFCVRTLTPRMIATAKMSHRIETFIIYVIQGIDDLVLEIVIGHRFSLIQQVYDTGRRYFFKAVLTGEKSFKQEKLAAGRI